MSEISYDVVQIRTIIIHLGPKTWRRNLFMLQQTCSASNLPPTTCPFSQKIWTSFWPLRAECSQNAQQRSTKVRVHKSLYAYMFAIFWRLAQRRRRQSCHVTLSLSSDLLIIIIFPLVEFLPPPHWVKLDRKSVRISPKLFGHVNKPQKVYL